MEYLSHPAALPTNRTRPHLPVARISAPAPAARHSVPRSRGPSLSRNLHTWIAATAEYAPPSPSLRTPPTMPVRTAPASPFSQRSSFVHSLKLLTTHQSPVTT